MDGVIHLSRGLVARRRTPVVSLDNAVDDYRAEQDCETGQHSLALGRGLERDEHILSESPSSTDPSNGGVLTD